MYIVGWLLEGYLLVFSYIYLLLCIGMDYPDPKRKSNFVGKIILAASLTAICIIMLKQSPNFSTPTPVALDL